MVIVIVVGLHSPPLRKIWCFCGTIKTKRHSELDASKTLLGKATVWQLERYSNKAMKISCQKKGWLSGCSLQVQPHIECFTVFEFLCWEPQVVFGSLFHPLYKVLVIIMAPPPFFINNLVNKVLQVVIHVNWFWRVQGS